MYAGVASLKPFFMNAGDKTGPQDILLHFDK